MKTKTIIIAIMSSITVLTACNREVGSGSIISEERTVNSFTKIEVSNSADVEIIKGDTLKVEVSDYENLLDNISVETVNGKLEIKNKPFRIHLRNSKAKITITIPNVLTEIVISGSGNVTINDGLANTATLKISGSGNIHADSTVDQTSVNLSISGSGDIEMAGNTESVSANISGSGNINCGNLTSVTASCTISGSGNITVNASETLNGHISGSGDIKYYGNPAISTDISGSGSIRKQ